MANNHVNKILTNLDNGILSLKDIIFEQSANLIEVENLIETGNCIIKHTGQIFLLDVELQMYHNTLKSMQELEAMFRLRKINDILSI